MKTKDLTIIAIVVVGALFLMFSPRLFTNNSGGTLSQPVTDYDQVVGTENAPVTIVEYSDFQCPACATYYPIVKEILAELNSDVRFVYRNFPLSQVHLRATLAAQAAEAAGLQDKFWEMHDILFENQSTWANGSESAMTYFTNYATSIGLDVDKFQIDIESSEVINKVQNDYQSGIASGVNSTPTFFVNGEKISSTGGSNELISVTRQLIFESKN